MKMILHLCFNFVYIVQEYIERLDLICDYCASASVYISYTYSICAYVLKLNVKMYCICVSVGTFLQIGQTDKGILNTLNLALNKIKEELLKQFK